MVRLRHSPLDADDVGPELAAVANHAVDLQWYGTPLLVLPYAYDATATTIVEAVRRLGGVIVKNG